MKSPFKIICVAWLGLWVAVATLIVFIPITITGLLSRTGNLAFSISKLWAYAMLGVSFVRTEIKNKEKIQNGTRSPDGRIYEFKKGGFVTAVRRKLPILPVTINGSRRVLPKGGLVMKPGKIQVVIGDPIDTSSYAIDTAQELIAKTRQAVMANFDSGYTGKGGRNRLMLSLFIHLRSL